MVEQSCKSFVSACSLDLEKLKKRRPQEARERERERERERVCHCVYVCDCMYMCVFKKPDYLDNCNVVTNIKIHLEVTAQLGSNCFINNSYHNCFEITYQFALRVSLGQSLKYLIKFDFLGDKGR